MPATPELPAVATSPPSPPPRPGPVSRRPHRAWGVAAVAGVAIVTAGAFTTVPGLITPALHHEFGWSRSTIGLAASVAMVLYGLTAPFAAALMDRYGIRRVVAGALLLVATGAALTTVMTAAWQLVLFWGVLVGLGSGSLTMTLAATVAQRWFTARRGLVTGALSASAHVGQMLFLPLLALGVERFDWRPALITLALTAAAVTTLVLLLLHDHPARLGLRPYGAGEDVPAPPPTRGAARRTLAVLAGAARSRVFWLLAAMFVICGASTNGILWTNFAPAAHDHGMPVPVAAGLLSAIGVFSALGTLGSGWLTDRLDPRLLLAVYFAVRALTLLLLPLLFAASVQPSMVAFVVVYGLVDVATVPPVIALTTACFGADGPIVFGWVNSAHQIGAGISAFLGAAARDLFGSYDLVWFALAVCCLLAALTALVVRVPPSPATLPPRPVEAAVP
ncbi:MFS transporter [Streptomyces otsuchiensis]|uniref:MFS transporter n=1 Tax=Streptomyces otsuchiensis TaxID=2681388 RepID=UPI001030CDD5